ncbi:SRPBCC family protein [Gordonia sp. CPCC 205515]|uniref:SRPBCC family protein n=1 Tax=Gordonia sp. CPCC 205515 TaxID=3140791 RepID=UPI003AF3B447
MTSIHRTSVVAAPRDAAFAYVNEHGNVPKFFFGISKFEPVTEKTEGLGSRFAVEMTIGPKAIKATVETTKWVANELIEITAIDGFRADTTWTFSDVDGGTEIDVTFDYHLPGGLAGRALGLVIEPVVGQAVRHTESSLTEQIVASL